MGTESSQLLMGDNTTAMDSPLGLVDWLLDASSLLLSLSLVFALVFVLTFIEAASPRSAFPLPLHTYFPVLAWVVTAAGAAAFNVAFGLAMTLLQRPGSCIIGHRPPFQATPPSPFSSVSSPPVPFSLCFCLRRARIPFACSADFVADPDNICVHFDVVVHLKRGVSPLQL